MCICMMYNLGDCWTMEEIENYTQIPEGELRLHLLGLSSPKFPILTRIENQVCPLGRIRSQVDLIFLYFLPFFSHFLFIYDI